MKYTLLELVQSVLSNMDSDNVNQIDETEESEQVALLAKEVYFNIANDSDWEHLHTVVQFNASGSLTEPTIMSIPDGSTTIESVQYKDSSGKFYPVDYLRIEDFMYKVMTRNSTNDNIITVDTPDSGIPYYVKDDSNPSYWARVGESHIIFDSYDSSVDDTLQTTKTLVSVVKQPSWTHEDTFTPSMPEDQFPMYLAELKQACNYSQRQQSNPYDDGVAIKSRNRNKRLSNDDHFNKRKPTYGRQRYSR